MGVGKVVFELSFDNSAGRVPLHPSHTGGHRFHFFASLQSSTSGSPCACFDEGKGKHKRVSLFDEGTSQFYSANISKFL